MSKQPIVIKKYANRRLYDTHASQYINLDGVAELVRQGEAVQVVEAKGGEDITRQVLTQIIVEGSKGGAGGPPIEFLRDMVRSRDRAYRDFLNWYLRGAAEVYDRLRAAWERSPAANRPAWIDWSKVLDPTSATRNLSQLWQDQLRRAFESPLSRAATKSDVKEPGGRKKSPARARKKSSTSSRAEREELSELRRRLEELEARLGD